jgi:hypothetical protein
MSLGARIFLLLVPLVTALDSTARAVESGDFAGLVDIGGGRKMHLECRGTGSPTVVLVAGLKGSAEDWGIVEKTAPTGLLRYGRLSVRMLVTPRSGSWRGVRRPRRRSGRSA